MRARSIEKKKRKKEMTLFYAVEKHFFGAKSVDSNLVRMRTYDRLPVATSEALPIVLNG